MATKASKTNERGTTLKGVDVIPVHVYRGILRITTKSTSKSANESTSYETTDEKDVIVVASPSTVSAAFDAVRDELLKNYANPDMVTIVLIEYRDMSTDNLCFSVV